MMNKADHRHLVAFKWVVGHVCIGINGESSFEAALLERALGCEVWGYDFTVDRVGSFNFEANH
jgi:hypothetical protein